MKKFGKKGGEKEPLDFTTQHESSSKRSGGEKKGNGAEVNREGKK